MLPDYKNLAHDLSSALGEVRKGIPNVTEGFSKLAQAAMVDGVLNKKTKELITIALAVAARCEGCIAFHIKTLVQLGTTREELLEALGVTMMMGGGPSFMYAAEALKAFDEFSENKVEK